MGHTTSGQHGFVEEAGTVGQAEQVRVVENAACRLGAADHAEMALKIVEPSEEHDAAFIVLSRRFE